MSEEMASSAEGPTREVFVRVLGEETDVWRPTRAVLGTHARFTLLATDDYDPADETWEFPPGSVVDCHLRTLGGHEVLVACAPGGWSAVATGVASEETGP